MGLIETMEKPIS